MQARGHDENLVANHHEPVTSKLNVTCRFGAVIMPAIMSVLSLVGNHTRTRWLGVNGSLSAPATDYKRAVQPYQNKSIGLDVYGACFKPVSRAAFGGRSRCPKPLAGGLRHR